MRFWTATLRPLVALPLLVVAVATASAVQDRAVPDAPASAFDAVLENAKAKAAARKAPAPQPGAAPPAPLDDASLAVWQETLRKRLAYEGFVYEHRERIYTWQHYSTIGIFIVVIGLVVAGLYFAWLQFEADQRRGQRAARTTAAQVPAPAADGQSAQAGDGAQPAAAKPAHAVELGTQGVKVTSPVLGVVILALAMGFFYLYLFYVYPIKAGS